MNLALSAEERALTAAVRAFVSDWRHRDPFPAAYFQELLARGWSVPLWPARWGGGGLTVEQAFLVDQTLVLAGGPTLNPQTVSTIGPLLMWAADEESCERWLPAMARGEARWCSHSSLHGGSAVAGDRAPGGFRPATAEIRIMGAREADGVLALAAEGQKVGLVVAELVPDAVLPGGPLDPDTVFTRLLSFERVGPLLFEAEFQQQMERLRWCEAARSISHSARLRRRLQDLSRQEQMQDEEARLALTELEVMIGGLEVLERRALRAADATLSEALSARVQEAGQWLSRLAIEALGYYALPAPNPTRQHNELSAGAMAGQDAIGELIRYVGGREAIAARDRMAVLEGLSLGPASQQGE